MQYLMYLRLDGSMLLQKTMDAMPSKTRVKERGGGRGREERRKGGKGDRHQVSIIYLSYSGDLPSS